MSYATPSDLIARYDARRLGDYVSDDGTRATEAELAIDDRILVALESASGEVEVALRQSGRYSVADLAGLTGASAEYLKQLVCDIAFCRLYERRGYGDDGDAPEMTFKRAQEALKRLRIGENVFNLVEQVEAGLPSMASPERVQLQRPTLLTQQARGRYFPSLPIY